MSKPDELEPVALDAAVDAGAIDAPYGSMTYVWQLEKAICAYLSASRSTSEAEPVAWRWTTWPHTDIDGDEWSWTLTDRKATIPSYATMQPLYTLPTPASDDQVEAHLDTLDSCLESFWCSTSDGSDNRLLADAAIDAVKAIRAALASMGSTKK